MRVGTVVPGTGVGLPVAKHASTASIAVVILSMAVPRASQSAVHTPRAPHTSQVSKGLDVTEVLGPRGRKGFDDNNNNALWVLLFRVLLCLLPALPGLACSSGDTAQTVSLCWSSGGGCGASVRAVRV